MSHLRFYAAYHCKNEDRRIKCLQDYLQKNGENCQVQFEYCYNIFLKVGSDKETFLKEHVEKIRSLLNFDLFEDVLQLQSILKGNVLEVGPRLSIKTAYCTNVLSILDSVGIQNVDRIERSRRYSIGNNNMSHETFLNLVGDKMTEFVYTTDSMWGTSGIERQDFTIIDLLSDENNLRKANIEMGLAFDEADILYYLDLYRNKLKRNPTDVELFDLAQSDSEHSRHWFFNGILSVDRKTIPVSLMKMVKSTLLTSNPNSVIAFCDNSSAIQGFGSLMSLYPEDPTRASFFQLKPANRHIIYSAETHNFPTAVCPFQGATTGTGGRIRDIHSTGKGAYEIAGIAGYSVGNLYLDGYDLPWECTDNWKYPPGFSCPGQIIIDASNGVSDYGNKFGEPVICGFTRTFGLRLHDKQRYEYAKPILFSGGVGTIDEENVKKIPRKKDNVLTKIGGPAYRIGVGGGAASSLAVQGSRDSHLDFGAVQRGDPEMGQKLHRVVRSCAEHVDKNPILAIHDQGAGGNGNVLRELVENQGAVIKCNAFELGDPTLSVKELWTAEYQESDAALVDKELIERIARIAKREKCKVSFVGEINDSMKLIVEDFAKKTSIHPVEHDLRFIGTRDRKLFNLETRESSLEPLVLPHSLTVREALERVLRLPAVSSKRYLTCKVDRSVTGLIAQQQCVGPLHTPIADVSVVALSHFDKESTACPYREDCRSLLLDAHDMSHLTTLVLSKNPDLHIEESGLNLFENITYMDLSQTLLPTSFPTWLEQRSRLTNLNISHSDLSLAEDEWSSCGEHLTSLDISGMRIKRINLATDCPLKFLGATDNLLEITQIRAVGLEVLSLDRNLLTSFPQPPPGISLEHLHTLSLSNNLLTTLTADTLSHLPSLQHLDLSHNQLSEVDKLAFPSVGLQLISLDISFNQLSVLPHPVLPSLLMLDASSNALVTIDPVLFAGLPQLQHLRLSNNVLLFTRCQTDCWSDHLDELTGLVELDLSNCALSRSLPLSHLISLRSLYLRGNQILNVDATDLPKSVYTLDLGDNRIHFTSNFSHLRTLNDLRVDGNPLRCDCSLFDVVDHLMNQSEITNPDLYFCYSASWQYPLLPYLASVKPCDYYQQRTFIPMLVSTVAFAIIVVSTFILSFVLWKRYIPRLWHFYKRLDLQVAEDDELPVRL